MDTKENQNGKPSARFTDYPCRQGCPVEAALEHIAGKWKGLIIYNLLEETLRFSELSRRVGNVTQRSLTKQLRELEASGIINRKVFPVIPPKVEYSLTDQGRKLKPVIDALYDWGKDYRA